MSLLVRNFPLCSRNFLRRPNTYALMLPTGSDFCFSIPFNREWLHPLRPLELATLHNYISNIYDDVVNRMCHLGTHNIFDIRHEISARLSSADQLTEVENRAWAVGHGDPVFNPFHGMTTSFWDWNAILFECGPSVVAWYARWLYDFQYKPSFERYAVRRSMRIEENNIWYRWEYNDNQLIFEWYCGRGTVCVKIHDTSLRDFDEWKTLETRFEEHELEMLRGTAGLRNAQSVGWELVGFLNGAGFSVTASVISNLEHVYEPNFPCGGTYLRDDPFSEYGMPNELAAHGECHHQESSIERPRKHYARNTQPADTWGYQTYRSSHSAPADPFELLNQVDALANTVRNLDTRLSHIDKPQPPSYPPRLSFPYPTHYPKYTVPPPTPQPSAPTTMFPVTTIREDPTSKHHPYQAYAEDENDESAEDSIQAVPNTWRDV